MVVKENGGFILVKGFAENGNPEYKIAFTTRLVAEKDTSKKNPVPQKKENPITGNPFKKAVGDFVKKHFNFVSENLFSKSEKERLENIKKRKYGKSDTKNN